MRIYAYERATLAASVVGYDRATSERGKRERDRERDRAKDLTLPSLTLLSLTLRYLLLLQPTLTAFRLLRC